MTTVIEYKNVTKSYDDSLILKGVNATIEKGDFITMIGSSGGGKTTMLKMVNGLIQPTSGDVIVDGKNNKEQDLIALRRNIGYAIQGSVLFPHMTIMKILPMCPIY